MSVSISEKKEELLLAQAFLLAANKCRISLRDRRKLITKAASLQNLMRQNQAATEKESPVFLREDVFINFHMSYREAYQQLQRENKKYPADLTVILCTDQAFPRRLQEIDSCPSLLFGQGENWDILNFPSLISVVGSRTPSHYGMEVTRCLARDLAQAGVVVVSGGAVGIDTLAHRHTLAAAGRTCAVLGSGLNRPYPHSNKSLFSQICSEGGLVISEFLLDEPPKKQNFPQRNRLIAALADALVVTEAGEKSGTLITADFAADYGREVFAVPGSVFSGRSRSCHQLIKEGASLLQGASDLEIVLPGKSELVLSAEEKADAGSSGKTSLSEEEQLVLQCLCIAPASLTDLSRRSQLPVEQLALLLAHLRKNGYVDRARGLYTARASCYNF
ncbi:MAG: DNA-protecting protein DprA [Clostridiaceae bacterium]|jgi:DNA processing protein|nr:DNA-protecting protein DprA [Clostridiaceae bacterium]